MEPHYYRQMADIQENHWWHKGHRHILSSVIKGLNLPGNAKILEAGCGPGANLNMLKQFGEISAFEPDDFSIENARRISGIAPRKGFLPDDIPFSEPFDMICALDVIEHVEKDRESLKSLYKLIKPGGYALFTVPAYQFLWSAHDEINHHKRRYIRPRFRALLEEAGYEIEYISYYNSILLPCIFAVRLLKKALRLKDKPDTAMMNSPLINDILCAVFSFEKHILRRFSLPAGVSIIAVCRKPLHERQTATPANENIYDSSFFDWVEHGALKSARRLLPYIQQELKIKSVADIGCGTGAWLMVWNELDVDNYLGIDGEYVESARLKIPASKFSARNLAQDWETGGTFDLVQSFEVAEHLPRSVEQQFVRKLCSMGDLVLFSAAQPGQGGENHLNERPLSHWKALFESNGFRAFDIVRPRFSSDAAIEPWYRYNMLLFANDSGRQRLPASMLAVEILPGQELKDFSNWQWKLRRLALRPLPVPLVSLLSRVHYLIRNKLRPLLD